MELHGKEIPIFNLGEVSVGILIRVTVLFTFRVLSASFTKPVGHKIGCTHVYAS